MPTRADTLFDRYARAVTAQERFEAVTRAYADAEERAQALEVLAANERANLTALEESFAVLPVDFGAAGQALQERYALEVQQRQQAAAAQASRQLTAAQRAAIEQPGRAQALNALYDLTADPSVTAEELAQARQLFSARHGALTQGEDTTLQQAAPAQRAQAIGARPGALTAAERGTEQALQALFFAGPQGIYGGFEGQAEVNERAQRQAPEGSRFTTGQDAFNVYLRLLEDGEVTAEELAQELGHESAQAAAADLAFAKAQYDNARAAGAFTNDQRKYFEGRWLDAARQAKALQARAEQARARVPADPRQAAIRAELQRRGVDVDDPFYRYRGTPMYQILTDAERLYQSGDLKADTKPLQKVEDLLRQYQKAGTAWKVDTLEAELRKTMQGEELQQALSFALAYQRQLNEGAPGADTAVPLAERRAPEPEPEPSDDDFLMQRQQAEQAQAEQQRIADEIQQQAQRQAQQQAPQPPAPTPAPTPAPQPAPQPAPAPSPAAPDLTARYQQRLSELQADTTLDPAERQRRVQAIEAELARRQGQVTPVQPSPSAGRRLPAPQPPDLMQQLIDALDAGDMERVQALNAQILEQQQ